MFSLSDFGMAMHDSQAQVDGPVPIHKIHNVGNIHYIAPEVHTLTNFKFLKYEKEKSTGVYYIFIFLFVMFIFIIICVVEIWMTAKGASGDCAMPVTKARDLFSLGGNLFSYN